MINEKEKELQYFILQRILIIIVILLILIAISLYSIQKFVSKIKKNFTIFKETMISAKIKLKPINTNSLDYDDFAELAEVTNSMTERINQLLHYDELTGIFNRRYMVNFFNEYMLIYPRNIGVILFDIDLFKKVNDNFGHEIGDKVLIDISNIIKINTPSNGAAGRFGGEEFIVILSNTSLAESLKVAQSIRISIESHYIKELDNYITISGGIAHSSIWNKDELFREADNKLYLAKEFGRNRIEY